MLHHFLHSEWLSGSTLNMLWLLLEIPQSIETVETVRKLKLKKKIKTLIYLLTLNGLCIGVIMQNIFK